MEQFPARVLVPHDVEIVGQPIDGGRGDHDAFYTLAVQRIDQIDGAGPLRRKYQLFLRRIACVAHHDHRAQFALLHNHRPSNVP